ncbi:glycoside hydrolase family 2 protein [Compostibacter hankyongensis]|uniref:Glycoside hydrolase family 2 TIM barrel-domain containing protein n=1 Tax=Compostibacter hankyongensis TaxID=1007089 RepID=A0ABP8FMV6_9BACT
MRKTIKTLVAACCLLLPHLLMAQNGAWRPADGPLTTPWTDKVTPVNVHAEYPRPQMQREKWENLNGLWDYKILPAIADYDAAGAKTADGGILVPFPVESDLSGVKKTLTPEERLWYQRTFVVPASWRGQRVLLHFGAADWKADVWVNGKKIGGHQGGYDAFSFDITPALKETGKQQLTVAVWDPSDSGFQPVGKQSLNPRGIWYTANSGIWQTVWLEPVPENAIERLKMTPDIDRKTLQLRVNASDNSSDYTITATAFAGGRKITETKGAPGKEITLAVNDMQLWSPEHPFLYDLTVTLFKNGKKIDEVKSYFGMRKISMGKDEAGITRLLLNNKPVFQFGPLDQGFWPDGIYTAPTDEALKFDIEKTKAWGFNMIRKHVKVEPQRWYYWCDKLGMLVWQDMPSGDAHIRKDEPDINRVAQSAHNYRQELKQMMDEHYNHPSIVTWVPFNEGWGQFQTAEIARLVKQLDPTRLVDATTGWADRGVGDMHDMHKYPGPAMFPVEAGRASVLGEFGGQALVVKDHLWLTDFAKAPRHYKTSTSSDALHQKYRLMMDTLRILKKQGLSAAVYTQTTDVEVEVNGIMTYDRKVMKFDETTLRKMNQDVIREQ